MLRPTFIPRKPKIKRPMTLQTGGLGSCPNTYENIDTLKAAGAVTFIDKASMLGPSICAMMKLVDLTSTKLSRVQRAKRLRRRTKD